METRRFGRTGHQSTIAIFGAAAFGNVSQTEADLCMEQIIAAGINHIDVAPSYGQAELRIGPWMKHSREQFFLGCKTQERTINGAWNELQTSLKQLQTNMLDLYQLHAITNMEELDQATMKGGALEALIKAQKAGLARFLGITGHGFNAPAIYLEALKRFNFDSVLFPLNFIQMANPEYRGKTDELIAMCQQQDVGLMVIKSITKGPWGGREPTSNTWYEPFDQLQEIQIAINFALSYPVTGICTAGDIRLLPMVIDACENFVPISKIGKSNLINSNNIYKPLFNANNG